MISNFKFQISNSRAGFTMIELIITIAILSFGIIGVYGAFSPVVKLNSALASKFTASQLAQEGFEIVRNIRDTNFLQIQQGRRIAWSHGLLNCALGCQLDYKTATAAQLSENTLKAYSESDYLNITAEGFYGYGQGTATKFKRKITISQDQSGDILKVVVAIFWDDNGQEQSFETVGYLYNFQ